MLPPRAEPRRSCHGKRAGSGASVRRSLAAEKQYPQPTRGSWSGLQAVRGSEACIPEIQECGAPDRSRLQRNATSHAHRHGHGCPSVPAMQHCGGADHGRPPPLATNSSIERTRAAASLASPGPLPSDRGSHVLRSFERLRDADRGAAQQRPVRLLVRLQADPQQTAPTVARLQMEASTPAAASPVEKDDQQ